MTNRSPISLSHVQRITFALLVTVLNAVPGSLIAWRMPFDHIGMQCGIGLFLLIMFLLFCLPSVQKLLTRRYVQRAMWTALIVHFVSLCLIIGFFVEVMVGLFAIKIVTGQGLGDSIPGPFDTPTTVFITLVHGAMIATLYWFLVALLSLIFRSSVPQNDPHGFCAACGYNLTGNLSGRCPECGTPHKFASMGVERGSSNAVPR